MRLLLLFSGLVLSLSLAAQYPAGSIKSRLGYQTTGDGLVYRGAGAPAYSPGTLFNAWMYLDTTNYALYMYRNFQWTKLPLVNNGLNLDGSYVQLGGTLVENTQVERSTYTLDFGKISGSNNAWASFYGSDPHYFGVLANKDGTQTGLTIGNKVWDFETTDSDHVSHFSGSRFGFDATYLGTLGVSFFRMDSTRFLLRGLPSYSSHSAATSALSDYQLYHLNGDRTIYVNEGSPSGAFTMPFDSLTFNPTTADPDTAELKYNADLETFVFGADGTIIEIGQKSAWYVKNQTGSTITKGTVVRASGTLGSSGRILISPMVIDGTVDSKYLLGITASDIANGSDGYVIHFGKLRKFNTSAWSDGAVLYAGTGGTLTAMEPSPPNLRLPIAFVVHSHATNGILAIRIQTGNELHELHDVDTTGIDNGGVLVWNAASEKWEASNGAVVTAADTSAMLSKYIERGDTAAMLAPYVTFGNLTGYPIGSGTADRSARWSATNTLAAGNLSDNGTRLQALLPWQFQTYTTAGLPTGVTGYHVYNTTTNGPGWYQGSRWAYGLESTFNRGTSTRVPYFNANGQITDNSGLTYNGSTLTSTGIAPGFAATGDNNAAGIGYRFNGIGTGFYGIAGNSTNPMINVVNAGNGNTIQATTTGSGTSAIAGRFIGSNVNALPFSAEFSLISSGVILDGMRFGHINNSTGAPFGTPNNTGVAMAFYLKDSLGTNVVTSRIATMFTRNSVSNFTNALIFSNARNGTVSEVARFAGLDLGIGTTSPTERLHVSDDVRVGDSLRLTTTPAHTSITGLLTRDANGWVGLASLAGLSYSGGVLTGTNIYNTDGNLGDNVTRTFSQGSNGDFIQYRTTTTDKRHKTYLSIPTGNADYDDEARVLYQSGGTKNRYINHYKAVGIYDGTGNYAAAYQTSERNGSDNYVYNELYSSIGSGTTQNFAGLVVGADSTNSNTISSLKIITENSASKKSHWAGLIDGSYGNGGWGNFTARMISYSPSFLVQTTAYNSNTYYNWLAIKNIDAADTATTNAIEFYNGDYAWKNGRPGTGSNVHVWDNGTPSFKEIKRDTTIYIDDADYDFSAAITTAQIASRFNRVIFWMTTTGAAGSDSELTLHTPDANLMQVEYLIHSVDEAGGFSNKIVFGTNNAVDSTNGLVTNYYPAAGDGIHIRAGLRSAAYKYRYSN
jgi:hypothetical protein